MPIRTENKNRYPKDWKRIRAEILKRAKDCCEQCGVPDRSLGYWGDDQFVRVPQNKAIRGLIWVKTGRKCGTWKKVIRIVLTVAHLDHQPENCDPDNLRALCQRCHNRYDIPMRVNGRLRRRMEATGTTELNLKAESRNVKTQ